MYKTSLRLPAELSPVETAILCESTDGLSAAYCAMREENHDQSPWVLEWLCNTPVESKTLRGRIETTAEIHGIALPNVLDFKNEDVPDRDWLSYSYKQFPPFSVGPFFIYGSHYEDGVPDGQIGLQIDAATAFGSGEHGTTKGCLQAMLDLKGQGGVPVERAGYGHGQRHFGSRSLETVEEPGAGRR